MKACNILITSASRHYHFPIEVYNVLKMIGEGKVYVSNSTKKCASFETGLESFVLPLSDNENFIHLLIQRCKEKEICIVIPASDIDTIVLSSHKSYLNNNGIWPVCNGNEFVQMCVDKAETHKLFRDLTCSHARTYQGEMEEVSFPCIIKPRSGCASKDVVIANNSHELNFFRKYLGDSIVQEFVRGTEYSIDIISSFEGRLLGVIPRKRSTIRNGVTDKGCSTNDAALIKCGIEFAQHHRVVGLCNIQGILDRNMEFICFDVNPRISGGIMFSVKSNMSAFTEFIKSLLGLPICQPELKNTELQFITREEYIFHSNVEIS